MKLLGKDLPSLLLERLQDQLRARGLLEGTPPSSEMAPGVEARVDPLSFNVSALEEHADPTRPLPLHTHRAGVGRLVLAAKWTFRKTCQVFINETLGRQRAFNGHVRDSYAQLAAEVIRLRRDVDALKNAAETRVKDTKPTPARGTKTRAAATKPKAPSKTESEATTKRPRKPRTPKK